MRKQCVPGSFFSAQAREPGLDTWYYDAVEKKTEECLCLEQSCELFSDIRGRGGASNACFHS